MSKLVTLLWNDGIDDASMIAAAKDALLHGACVFVRVASEPVPEALPDGVQTIAMDTGRAGRPKWAVLGDKLREAMGQDGCVLVLAGSERPTRELVDAVVACKSASEVQLREVFRGKLLHSAVAGPQSEVRAAPLATVEFRSASFGPEIGAEGVTSKLPGRVLKAEDRSIDTMLDHLVARARHASLVTPTPQWAVRPSYPFAATISFLWRYVCRGGFIDGVSGYHRAVLESNLRFMAWTLVGEQMRAFEHEPGLEWASEARGYFPVSCVILTKDEEVNIEACLDSLSFSDDIVVYDSKSTDRTVELAEARRHVRVVSRQFDNWSSHQNWGVQNIEFKHPWVLYVDADELVPPELAAEIMRLADPASPNSAFRMRRKDMFLGRWIKRASLYPTWLVRLFRPEKISYKRLVNPVAEVDGPVSNLEGHLIHYPFSKGVRQWVERHNSYSSFEAMEVLKVIDGSRKPVRGILSQDPNTRRAALKDLFYRMPLRPHIKYLYYVVARRAFLDLAPGWIYARLQYLYEYMITIKVKEELIRRREMGQERAVESSPNAKG